MRAGDMHRRGTPPAAQDLALALQYLTQAADGGHLAAAHSLGTMAESGEGITGGPDVGAAAAWYQVAAEGGHPSGMADYAYFVEHGHGVAQVARLSDDLLHVHAPAMRSPARFAAASA